MKRYVNFMSNGLKIAAHLYVPDDYNTGERRAAIVVSHPLGGVKEQVAGHYSRRLAEQGFVTLAFDCAYQGESEGLPRYLEDPFIRTEDIKCAVSFLSTLDEVDSDRIGALGICASGGYVPFTAQTDRRIKAVATVSGACVGKLFREGLGGGQSREKLNDILEASNKDRIEQAQGKAPRLEHIVPDSAEEITAETPFLFREAYEYYRTPRAQHPNSHNWYVLSSVDRIVAYDSYDRVHLISPHPLLMIAGTRADTRYFSEEAIANAREPKELFLIEGATHIDLYDQEEFVSSAVDRLNSFYKEWLDETAEKLEEEQERVA